MHPGRESNYKAKKEPCEQKPRSNGTVFRLPKGGGGELPLEPETFMSGSGFSQFFSFHFEDGSARSRPRSISNAINHSKRKKKTQKTLVLRAVRRRHVWFIVKRTLQNALPTGK